MTIARVLANGAFVLWATVAAADREPLPWEVWHDLHSLTEVEPGSRVLLRSSHSPDGTRYDRHSPDDPRFIRTNGTEGVIFETEGPGAITRIWMTSGSGTSVPLNPDTRIRFYFDGAAEPALDLTLPALFDGTTPPFTPPLALSRLASSGGNVSYVPIPYADGCRVTLVGTEPDTLWFHFTHHALPLGTTVSTFTGAEDLSAWRNLLASAGNDPWPSTPTSVGHHQNHAIVVPPGQSAAVAMPAGPDTITGLWFDAEDSALEQLRIRLVFDGVETVDLPLGDFFWTGHSPQPSVETVLMSRLDDGRFASFWPMPYRASAVMHLEHMGPPDAPNQRLEVAVRTAGRPPGPGAGTFTAFTRSENPTLPDREFEILDAPGRGRLVGLFLDLQSVDSGARHYLEGDAKLHLDRMTAPTWHGTGVEDTFNGGFYFDQGPVSLPLHGAPYVDFAVGEETASAAYRLFLSDGPSYCNGIRWTLENGPGPPTGHFAMRAHAVVFAYTRPAPGCVPVDHIDLGSPESLATHDFVAVPPATPTDLISTFEDGAQTALSASGLIQSDGVWRFTLTVPLDSEGLSIRRLLDAGTQDPGALLCHAGREIGAWPRQPVNTNRRWREIDLRLGSELTGPLELSIQPLSEPGRDPQSAGFTAFSLELWGTPPPLFADGFESGSTDQWSATLESAGTLRPHRHR